ncbi:GGDEF domain-containing protein [Massilia horti]|nr:GGDEF domain-containing protein [Massilia horti]
MPFGLSLGQTLPEQDERALATKHNAALAHMLPLWGPLFGATVVLFTLWDFWIMPARIALTAPLRLALVLIGSIAYRQWRLPWTPVHRAGFIYATHASGMVAGAALLPNGLLIGLAAITATLFLVSLVALRLSTFVLIVLPSTLLLIVLGLGTMSPYGLINTIVLYLFAAGIAAAMMAVLVAFRRQAFLFEKQLLHSARHDSLSGAANRGYLNEAGAREVALARRHKRPLALAMIDIDHFKRVNDIYGHVAGDNVIRELANVCRHNLREGDLFGRFGGEEFVCVMPETEADQAFACVERIRRSIEALRLDTGRGPLQFTISTGIAVLGPGRDQWESLLQEADDALYQAKGGGRNRTQVAGAQPHDQAAP